MEDIPINTGKSNGMGDISMYPPGYAPPDESAMLPPGVTASAMEETFAGPLETRLTHTAWKARKGAFEELKDMFTQDTAAAAAFVSYLKKGVKDSNASALEAALEAAQAYVQADESAAVDDFLLGVMESGLSSRPKAVTISQEIIALSVEGGHAAVVIEYLEKAATKARAAKHKQGLSATLKQLFTAFGGGVFDAKQCLPVLVRFLGEADAKVREAARAVVASLHQTMGPAIVTLLESKGVKASTVAELTKACEDLSGLPAPTRTVRGAEAPQASAAGGAGGGGGAMGGEAVDAMMYDSATPEPVLKYLPKDFHTVITDPKAKWAVKKAMVDDNLTPHVSKIRLQPDNYQELAATLKKALSDSNIAMVALSCKSLLSLCKGLRTGFSREARILFPLFLSLQKEKKIAVAEPLRDILFAIFQHGILNLNDVADQIVKASGDKVLLIRLGTLQWMERCVMHSAERAQKTLELFSSTAVKVLETDVDAGVKDAACRVCVALYKQCGEASCGFLNDLNPKAHDKVLKAVASGDAPAGAAGRKLVGTPRVPSARSLNSTVNSSSATLDDDADKRPLKSAGSAGSRAALGRSASGRAAPKAAKAAGGGGGAAEAAPQESAPPPYGRTDVESMLESALPAEAAGIVKGLASKAWKERLEAASHVGSAFAKASTQGAAAIEIASSLFHAAVPGWKDTNFQVVQCMVKVLSVMADSAGVVPPRVVRAVGPVVEKLQDAKIKGPLRELLLKLCETSSPRVTVATALEVLNGTKSPKTLQEGLDWLCDVMLEFGGGVVDEKAVTAFALKCLDMPTPAIKGGSLKLFGALARCCGPATVLRVVKATDLRPALLQQIEDECEKAKGMSAIVPKRVSKGASSGGGGGGGGGGSLDAPQDIRPLLDSALLDRMSSSSWSEREAALEELMKIVSRKLRPDVGHDLVPALKQRLTDTNKKIPPIACSVVAEMFEGMGASSRMHGSKLVPIALTLLGDAKPLVRTGARKVLAAYDKVCGLDGLLPFLPKAMSTDVPSARQELSEFLAEVFRRDAVKMPRASLQPTLQPLVAFLQDKNGVTRKHAEEMLKPLIENIGYDAVAKHVGDLGAANQRALQPILDKNKQYSREPQKPQAKRPRVQKPLQHEAMEDVEEAMMPPRHQAPAAAAAAPSTAEPMEVDPPGDYRPKQMFKSMTRDAMEPSCLDTPMQPMHTPMMPRQNQHTVAITSMNQAIELLNSSDNGLSARAAEKVLQFQQQGVDVPIDQVMLKAMGRLTTICTDMNVPLDIVGSKALVAFMTEIFQPPLSRRTKADTMYYLIGALLDNLLTEKLHMTYRDKNTCEAQRKDSDDTLRSLNSLMLKLLERSGRAETFCALLKRLDKYNKLIYNESSRYVKYVELVAKCLLKLIRFIAQENTTDFTKLLSAVHEFLTENPPTNFRGKMELPLRTVKTLLNELVKLKGESIRDSLLELNISENALIADFINMILKKIHDEEGGLEPAAPAVQHRSLLAAEQPARAVAPAPAAAARPVAAPSPQAAPQQAGQRRSAAAAGAAQAPAAGAAPAPELAQQMDEIFLRVRKTETFRDGVRELYVLMHRNPSLDITPWLAECSAPFQGLLQRQLAAHASAQQTGAEAPSTAPLSNSSMTSIRERMERVRAARAAAAQQQ